MEYEIGQIFDGTYPPEAAQWCNDGQLYHIEEIESQGTTTDPITGETVPLRRFQIVENPPAPEPTPEEIAAQEKAKQEREFVENGNARMTAVEAANDDIILMLADMIGGE